MSGRLEAEDRSLYAETHLAGARSQNTGNGILGIIPKIKEAAQAAFLDI